MEPAEAIKLLHAMQGSAAEAPKGDACERHKAMARSQVQDRRAHLVHMQTHVAYILP